LEDQNPNHNDAYAPAEIAIRVRQAGRVKAGLPIFELATLAVLAGAFIALGAAFFTVIVTDSTLPFGITRLLGGLAFCLGLILVVVAGAELFTGNVLIVMAWASRLVSTRRLLRSWSVVYVGNLVGALATAAVMYLSHAWSLAGARVGGTALSIAVAKAELPFVHAFFLGVLCNALVCLAVWLCFSARSTTDRILCVLFPITAFVAMGFEHSIANMYFFGIGLLLQAEPTAVAAAALPAERLASLTWQSFLGNLVPVTLGNLVGGAGLVAAVYWFAYLRDR
jgi:formate/nitrite transporter